MDVKYYLLLEDEIRAARYTLQGTSYLGDDIHSFCSNARVMNEI